MQRLHRDYASRFNVTTTRLATSHTNFANWKLLVGYEPKQQRTDQTYVSVDSILPREGATSSRLAAGIMAKCHLNREILSCHSNPSFDHRAHRLGSLKLCEWFETLSQRSRFTDF